MKTTIMQAISLAVILLGIDMGLERGSFLILIGSLTVGALIGERFDLEEKFNMTGKWFEIKIGSKEEGKIAKAFVTTTLGGIFFPFN